MKRVTAIVCIVLLVCCLLTSCKKTGYDYFDYDASKYVELGEYTGISYDKVKIEVTDKDVDDYILSLMKEKGYGEEKDITDRPVQNGDTANIDYVGKKDGVAFEGGTAKGTDLAIGSGTFIPGFEEGLVGTKLGETIDLELTFPEQYHNADLAGQKVVFTVKVNSIKTTVYPELTDEISKEIAEIDTVAELKTTAKTAVALQKEDAAKATEKSQIWSQVVNASKIKKVPEKEIKNQKESLLKYYDSQVQGYGMTYKEYIEKQGVDYAEFEAELDKIVEEKTKEYFVAVAIARKEKLDYDKESLKEKAKSEFATYGYTNVDDFLKAIDKDQYYLKCVVDNVQQFIVSKAVAK